MVAAEKEKKSAKCKVQIAKCKTTKLGNLFHFAICDLHFSFCNPYFGEGLHGGGYETRLTSVSNLEAGAGRRIVETALELAQHMQPGPLPVPPKAPPFRQPWSYGNVPPERE